MEHRVATDEICVKRGMGKPHQAAGGGSSESPPAVFWLQKTLLATTTTVTSTFFPKLRMKNKKIFGEVVTCFFD